MLKTRSALGLLSDLETFAWPLWVLFSAVTQGRLSGIFLSQPLAPSSASRDPPREEATFFSLCHSSLHLPPATNTEPGIPVGA